MHEVASFAEAHRSWEFVFVCDGCTDGSPERLETFFRGHRSVRTIRYTRNRGKGHAVRIGLLRARGRFRMFTDVDLAYPLSMAETIGEQLAGGNDVVIASRAHPESQIEISEDMKSTMTRRHSQSRVFSKVARKLLGIRQRDPQAGLKGLSARAAQLLLPYVKCNGFGFDCELMVACRFFGLHAREVPAHVRYTHPHTTTRLTTSVRMARELWAIRQRWRKIGLQGLPRSVFSSIASVTPDLVANSQDGGR